MDTELSAKEKHNIWIKNSGYLYDRLVVHGVTWPSLTFQWLPTFNQNQYGNTQFQFTIATHTSGRRNEEFLYIMKLQLPPLKNIEDLEPLQIPSKVTTVERFRHQRQINRARYCPINPQIIAARVDESPISIFKRGSEYPEKILSNYTFQSGFALQWNTYHLLAGDYNGNVLIWENIDQQQQPNKIECNCSINDIRASNPNVFLTVGDEGILGMWDIRSGKDEGKVKASEKQIYCLDVNKVNQNLILTGGEDQLIRLFDLRNYKENLYHFDGHADKVLNVKWSHKNPTVFASGAQDTKVKIWDLLRIGFEIPKDHSGTEQILFTHEGHQGEVLDLDWNPHCMLLGSSQEYHNTVQIYEIANCISDLEYAEDLEYLRDQCLA